jgi:hypothetical protein
VRGREKARTTVQVTEHERELTRVWVIPLLYTLRAHARHSSSLVFFSWIFSRSFDVCDSTRIQSSQSLLVSVLNVYVRPASRKSECVLLIFTPTPLRPLVMAGVLCKLRRADTSECVCQRALPELYPSWVVNTSKRRLSSFGASGDADQLGFQTRLVGDFTLAARSAGCNCE